MVHLSRKKEDMASNGLEHSMLNDSLEIGEWRATASVAPETRNGGTDYSAFSENGALYLGLFPHYVVNMLQDKSSWKNRASGIGEIQSTLSSVQDSSTLEANLPMIVNLVTIPLGDANFKVAQTGLELVGCLVLKVGRGLTPYLPVLVPRILAKMGSNKYAIRQAGMKVLMQLMHCCKVQQVLSEITDCGLQHTNSRVRGESINVVIAALLTFPKTELPLLPLVKEIAPILGDEKQKVRQASLEAIALLSHLIDRADLKEVVATVANAEKVRGRPERGSEGVSMMDAFHTRLSRQVYPQLNSDGLVEHAIPVANAKALHSYAGADVDWILASKGSKVPEASGGNTSVTQGPVPTTLKKPSMMQANGSSTSGTAVFRPYRSAGKRLPWEMEAVEEAASTSTATNSSMMNGHAIFKPKEPPPPTLAPRMSLASSPKHVTGERGLPPYEPTTSRKTGGSYADMYLTKLQRGTAASIAANPVQAPGYSHNGSLKGTSDNTLFIQRTPLPPHANTAAIPSPITAKRHCSLPEGVLPHSSVSQSTGGHWQEVPASKGHQLPLVYGPHPDVMGPGMSVSWPRSRMSVPVEVPRGSQQISANASAMVRGVHGSVKTNMSRPLSKPRVRNPLTSLKPQHQDSPQHRHGPQRDSPTQIEREFLASSATAGWGETWEEEEFYRAIPDDTTHLDSSLSSSLTSLCATSRDTATARAGETDKLKHIRKEAASRKAQLLSAECSISNSPELSGTPPLRHPTLEHGYNRQEEGPLVGVGVKDLPPTLPKKHNKEKLVSESNQSKFHAGRKWNSNGSVKPPPTQQSLELIDLNRTYVIKEDMAVTATPTTSTFTSGKKPSQVGALSKLKGVRRSTPLQSQGDEPNEPLSREISLEGHSLERGGVSDVQPKKKSRKLSEPTRGNAPPKPRASRSNSFAVEGQQRRPSIERGGTNMIDMEVSGIGSSRRTEEGTDTRGYQTPSLSQATKESIARKKQRQLEDEEPGMSSHSTTYPMCKPPIHPQPTDLAASAPVHHERNKQKHRSSLNLHNHHQPESGYGGAGEGTPRDRHCGRNSLTVETESYGSTTGGSPNGSQLEELNPFANPEHGLREAMQNLSSDDWSAKCEGMLAVRRLAMFHGDVLLPQLHSVVMAVQQEVKNLRSTVARGAIACFGDLFNIMGRAMEQDLDNVVRILLHKGGESNAFIREDVEKALTEMVNGVSPGKSLTALISGGLSHRNVHVRNTTSQFICVAIELYGPGRLLHSGKEVERVLPAIVQLVGDSAPEARYYARKSLDQLWPQPEFDRVASRVLSSQLLSKATQTIENLKAKGVGDPPSEIQSLKRHVSGSNRHSTGGPVRASMHGNGSTPSSHKAPSGFNHTPSSNGHSTSANYTSKRPPKKQHHGAGAESLGQGGMGVESVPLPEGLVDRLKANNWSERFEAVSDLENYVNVYPTALAPHLHKVFDAFSPRLTDRNSKVNLHALEAFSNIVPLLGNMLVPIVNNVVTALVPNLASRNPTIHSTAMTVLDLLSQCIDPTHLVQSVATNGQYGNARVQPIMIRKLAELTSWVYEQKPQLVSRQILPVMWHLLAAKTPATGEAKAAILALCAALYKCMGHSLLDSASSLSPEHQKKLNELVDSLDR